MLIKAIVGKGNHMKANTWQGALLKAFAVQLGLVGFLSLGWFGFVGGFGGADNPLWFYLGAVLQLPASLLFTTVLGLVTKAFPGEAQAFEVAGALVAVLEFVFLAVAIKKIRDVWLS
jgi:hypothetical protein